MALQDSQLDTIVAALVASNPTQATLRAALAGMAPTARIAEVPLASAPLADALGILQHLDRTAPQALLRILEVYGAASGDVAAIARDYASALRQPAADPLRERLLRGKKLMLDRGPLRDTLKTLVQTKSANVLLVTGPAKCGKSRTRELIQRLAEEHDHPFAVMAGAGAAGHAETVSQILVQLTPGAHDVDDVPSPDTHWYRKQCKRLVAGAAEAMKRRSAERCWIVVDHLGPVTGTVVELCDHLMAIVAPISTGMRLVLLGYPRDEAPDSVADEPIEWDRLRYGTVREGDIRDYLTWLFGEVVKKPLTPEALDAELARLSAGLAPEHEGFLRQVGRGLEERTREALQGAT